MRRNAIVGIVLVSLLLCPIGNGLNADGTAGGRGSLSVEECIERSLRNSFEVKLAKVDFMISGTDEGIANAVFDTFLTGKVDYSEDRMGSASVFGADLTYTNTYKAGVSKALPSGTELDLSIGDTRSWTNSEFVSDNPTHTVETSLEIRQPVGKNAFGYIDRRNVTATRLAIRNADIDTKERIERLIARVERAYWRWVYETEGLEIYRQILEQAQRLQETNSNNYDVGRIEKGDLLATQANVVLRRRDVRLAENRVRRTEEDLKLLMSMEEERTIAPAEKLVHRRMDLTLEESLKRALAIRRDYRKAKRDLEIRRIKLQMKENARWPEIDLVGSISVNGIDSSIDEAFSRMVEENNTKYYGGIEVSVPIENRTARSEAERASLEKERALLVIKGLERGIVTEVGNAFRDYGTYEAVLANLAEAARLQEEKLEEEMKRFNLGRSTTKTVIDYQNDYLRARLAEALGLLELEVARVDLEKALNTILEKYVRLL